MIAILTDFGCSEYLGVMKGVIYSKKPDAKIVDLCNTISSQSLIEGAWLLLNSYKFFPRKTVFLCVADPGVGGRRQCLAIKTKNYFFVGPDNGLMHPAASEDGVIHAARLEVKGAKTFQGRDVFAVAAAKIDSGADVTSLGEKTDIESKLDIFPRKKDGIITRIDNFGNIITNIIPTVNQSYQANICGKKIPLKFYETYEGAHSNSLFLIKGSAGTLEISIKGGSATKKLKASPGSKISIY